MDNFAELTVEQGSNSSVVASQPKKRHRHKRRRGGSLANNVNRDGSSVPSGSCGSAKKQVRTQNVSQSGTGQDSSVSDTAKHGERAVGRIYLSDVLDNDVSATSARSVKSSKKRTRHNSNHTAGKRGSEHIMAVRADAFREDLAPYDEGLLSLVFAGQREDLTQFAAFIASLHGVHYEVQADGYGVYAYRNALTGARAFFRLYTPVLPNSEVGVEFCVPVPEFKCSAYETLPLAVSFAREFYLTIYWRNSRGELTPVAVQVEDLLEVWCLQCTLARQRLISQGQLLYPVRSAVIDAVWEYRLLLEELHNAHNRQELQFPAVEYVRRKRTGEVQRLCRWSELLPTVFPPVDVIMLTGVPKPLREGRIISASELFSKGREWIKTEHIPIAHKVYVKANAPAGLLELLANLKGITMRSYDSIPESALDDSL